MPPYLAGREKEAAEFRRLLSQTTILENLVLTGLRGVGKTVLLETFKPLALQAKWLWVGTDLSESTSVSEENVALRLMTDLAVVTSGITLSTEQVTGIGFAAKPTNVSQTMDYGALVGLYERTPGLVADKLKSVLEEVWNELRHRDVRGLVFAYDEAQNMSDHPAKEQYPLALLLDVFQSIQKKGIPFMLALTGLPTLFPKLVESRTFAERMFRVVFLGRLDKTACREAIEKPVQDREYPLALEEESIGLIIDASGGYPYFIQFICREVFDAFLQKVDEGQEPYASIESIIRKLDADFFAGRWAKATDRQRELLEVIASLASCDDEFTVQEVVERSQQLLAKPFSSSHANQMLAALGNAGLIYKNRHGKYSFAVPLFGQFIQRRKEELERRS